MFCGSRVDSRSDSFIFPPGGFMPVWVVLEVLQCLFLFFAFLFVLFFFVVSFRKEDESFQSRMNRLYSSPWPI